METKTYRNSNFTTRDYRPMVTTETNRPTLDGKPIYLVPESNMENLKARVAKMNKRAAKLHMEPLVLTEVGEEFREIKERSKGTNSWDDDLSGREPRTYTIRIVHVTLEGTCPRVNGWALAAVIQHEDGGNILRTVPGFEALLPLAYRTASTGCDHCRINRLRNDTYILQSELEWKQVGRNCLADFLRSDNAGALAEYAEMLASIDSDMSGYEELSDGCRFTQYFDPKEFLAQVACCIRADGWCSRTEAKASYIPKLATVDAAMSLSDHKNWNRLTADEKVGESI